MNFTLQHLFALTSKVNTDIQLLRVHLKKGQLDKTSDILVDQISAIDNSRLIKNLVP